MAERKARAARSTRATKFPTPPAHRSPKHSPAEAQPRPQTAAGDRVGPTGHGAKLEGVRQAVIAALLSHSTVAAAARQAGVGERTVRRWLAEDSFRAEYDKASERCFNDALARIQVAGSRAVTTLETLLESREHPAVRLGAARTLLDVAIQRYEMSPLLDRLERLEATASPRERGGRS